MLMPKKVKYRKQQRGRMTGKAWRGSTLAFGDFGLKVLEPGWITDRRGYRYAPVDPLTQRAWPPIPSLFQQLAARAAQAAETQVDQLFFTPWDLTFLVTLFPRCTH